MRTSLDVLLNTAGSYSNHARIREDITSLAREYPTLPAKLAEYIYNDGRQTKLLVLQGTIPIHYMGNRYNIPGDIFIPKSYPLQPPMCFIRPQANMVIKPNHRHVGSDGTVYLPYLHSWNSNSKLVELVQMMSNVFSDMPPVYATTTNTTTTNNNNNTPTPTSATVITGTPVGAGVTTRPGVGVTAHQSPSSSSRGPNINSNSNNPNTYNTIFGNSNRTTTATTNNNDDFEQAQKQSLVDAVNERLRQATREFYERINQELSEELTINEQLMARRNSLSDAIYKVKKTKESCSKGQEELLELTKSLDEWLWQQNETQKMKNAEYQSKGQDVPTFTGISEDVTERIQSFDALSNQYVKVLAQHNAIVDTQYVLGQALADQNNTTVDLPRFIAEYRKLSRSLFGHKAHLKKIISFRK